MPGIGSGVGPFVGWPQRAGGGAAEGHPSENRCFAPHELSGAGLIWIVPAPVPYADGLACEAVVLGGLGDHAGARGCQVVLNDLVATFDHDVSMSDFLLPGGYESASRRV